MIRLIMDNEVITRWMDWSDISVFRDQLVELEYTLMKKYHYPELEIPIGYCETSVANLEMHMKSGNTFFWGATKDSELVAYYWAYIAPFINRKRWVLRSLMIRDDYQRTGLGTVAMQCGLQKALELNCDEMATEYVPWNTAAAELYHKNGFEIRRLEVVKELNKVNKDD